MSGLEARLREKVEIHRATGQGYGWTTPLAMTISVDEVDALLRRLGELEQVEAKVQRLLGVEHQSISLTALRIFFAEPEPSALSEAGGTDA